MQKTFGSFYALKHKNRAHNRIFCAYYLEQ